MDATPGPILNQVNVVARDWDASLAFYRLLGLDVAGGDEWPVGSGARHASVAMQVDRVVLEFDNPPMLRQYAQDADNVRGAVIGFAYPSAEAVDATVDRLQAAGYPVRQPAYDAFWGARYAIVEDPGGNAIGLMGPIDRSRQYVPGTRS